MRYFKNRTDAGQQLAAALSQYQDRTDVLVVALPRGGVPIAYEIAAKLHLPLTVLIARKLGVPGYEEVAMGAVAEGGVCLFNNVLLSELKLEESQIEKILKEEQRILQHRLQLYRHGKPLADLKNKTVILVDDGVATGMTLKAAIQALRTLHAKHIILAVPIASEASYNELTPLVQEVIALVVANLFYGVNNYYQSFDQVTEEEVLRLLQSAQKFILTVDTIDS